MNYYKAETGRILSAKFGSEKIQYSQALNFLKEYIEGIMAPGATTRYQILAHTMKGTGCTAEQAQDIMINFHTQMLLELNYMFFGADLYVQDRNLIDALLRTDIEALAKDVQMPYEYCQFVFPEGIPLGYEDYEVTGAVLVADVHKALSFCRDHMSGVVGPEWEPAKKEEKQMCFFTQIRRGHVTDKEGTSWIRFDPEEPLSALEKYNNKGRLRLARGDSEAVRRLAYLCMGLCLYLQTEEGLSALSPIEQPPRQQGNSPCVGRLAKKRKCMVIRDLITPKLLREHKDRENEPGYEVTPHLRRLHLRSLRHEKFKRNPNGSVRMVWVKPTIVHREKHNGQEHIERKIC